MAKSETITSPCIRDCCLGPADICHGCFRALEEICAWHSASESQRRAILQRCDERRKAALASRK